MNNLAVLVIIEYAGFQIIFTSVYLMHILSIFNWTSSIHEMWNQKVHGRANPFLCNAKKKFQTSKNMTKLISYSVLNAYGAQKLIHS